jgi:hypothetical protein
LIPRRGFGKSYEVNYKEYDSAVSKRFAKRIVEEVVAEKDALRKLT